MDTQLAQGVSGYEIPRRAVDIPRGETVTSRPRPELDALGAHLGSFLVFPALVIEEQYNDNIFATPNNEESDFITRIVPSLNINSDWNNHSLNFESGAAIGRYWDNTSEDYEDYYLGASGRVDIKRSTQFRARTAYRHLHEDRSSPDDVSGKDPTEFDQFTASAELFHDFGRFNATVGGAWDRLDFDDVDAVGGANINNDDRDRNRTSGFVRFGYEIVPDYEAFVRGSYNIVDYERGLDDSGVDRDSEGYGVMAGLEMDLGGILFGDAFIGARSQSYDDPTLDSLSGFGAGADLTWNVTGLTTIGLSALSDLRETTTTGASGRMVSTGEITVDHELLRNLLLAGNASVTRDDFEGINRTDWIYRAGLGATYMVNRYLHLSAEYDFRKRVADAAANDFTENIALVRLKVQY